MIWLRKTHKSALGGVPVASKGQGKTKKLPAILPDGGVAMITKAEAEKLSTINSVARLNAEGQTAPEISHALGISAFKVKASMQDARYGIALARARAVVLGDATINDAIAVARAEYRVARAWEVLDDHMDANDPWLRQQAAMAVIASAARATDGKAATEIVLTPELVFDDQDLQDDAQDTPDSLDLMVDDAT